MNNNSIKKPSPPTGRALIGSISYLIALLAAAGSALQAYMGFASFLGAYASIFLNTSGIMGLSIGLAGIMGGLVNLSVNFECLKDFLERLFKKSLPKLQGWKKFRYWVGSLIFVITGLLYGATAIAFGSVGVLSGVAIAAGIFVAILMLIQELETWLKSFDTETEKISLWAAFKKYWKELAPGKAIGLSITLVNVFALSLLFTLGVATFLTGIGVPVLPAIIAGLAIGFTAGAFAEFYFYNAFLSDFCNNLKQKWQLFKGEDSPVLWKAMGASSILINAIVNVALCYSGILLLNIMLASAGLALIPLPALCVAAVFSGAASFFLCSDFWIRNSKVLLKYAGLILMPWNCKKQVAGVDKKFDELPSSTSSLSPSNLSPSSDPSEPNELNTEASVTEEIPSAHQTGSCWSAIKVGLFGIKNSYHLVNTEVSSPSFSNA